MSPRTNTDALTYPSLAFLQHPQYSPETSRTGTERTKARKYDQPSRRPSLLLPNH